MLISERTKGNAVKRATDDTRPPSTSYRETYRRHRMLFRIPVLLGAAVAALILFTTSATYKSTASLWVDTAAPVASSIGADGTPTLSEPPASSEQGILTELLTTGSFADAVARSSVLGRELGSPGAIREGASKLLEHGQVVAAPAGGQILNVSYTGSSREIAESVLGGILTQLRNYNNSLSAQHSAAAIAYDRAQVALDEKALATANATLNTYAARHPDASKSDPNYLSLSSAQNTAVTQLGQANTTLNQVTGSSNSGGWTIRVLDAPSPASSLAPSKKKTVGVILGGALAGMLASFLAVVAMTPAKKEDWEDELPLGRPSERGGSDEADEASAEPFPVGSTDAPFPDASSTPNWRGHDRPLVATAGRRFVFGMSSEQMDET
jgi:uncharacterized protein involved in exopolysaccharide biosynthesis